MLKQILTLLLLLLLLVACNDDPASSTLPASSPVAGSTATTPNGVAEQGGQALPPPVAATVTPIPPTPTPAEPLAATVNGQTIPLSSFEEQLARYEQGQALVASIGINVEDDADHRQKVLDALIEMALIEQAAAASGIVITPQMVDQKITELRQATVETHGEGSFEAWLAANQYTEETFRADQAYLMLAERVVAVVTADIPYTAPHVHARYLEVADQALAQDLLDQIRNGADFGALAREYSLGNESQEEGDLGYFPEGGLYVEEVEQAAFSLEPGEISEVIAVPDAAGNRTSYYLVQVIDIDPERVLQPDFRSRLLQKTFEEWLAEQWSQAEIVRFIETEA